ncbi:beta-1,3-galactosyltransferase 2-like [Ranitomeya imitator]|uniref:beta-1,3-galactosyltransferase 2-like n=1 Tax=Ranitomeya imitator TaxID=111125 RepID=UPI0037E7B38E
MNNRMRCRIFLTLSFGILMFVFGFFVCYEGKIKIINKWTQNSEKLQERKKPVNNLIYPVFKHPLAPPYPFPYRFIINQPEKCKNQKPFLVIMVLVQSQDLASRHTIRETWGNESIYDVEVVRIFLVGLPQIVPERVQDMLEEESRIFGDIIQQDFMDTYYNLTLKTLMGMEWVTKFCPSASYVMKIDNDMFLNVNYLIHNLLYPNIPVRTNYFTGDIAKNTGPLRDKAYKWYVPPEVYPNDTYPPYCKGPGYVFSADIAKNIYDIAQEIRVIPMEDSFIGICLYELHIPLSEPPRGVFNTNRLHYDHCKFRKLITVHHYGGKVLRNTWADFWAKKSQKCTESRN